MGVSGADGTTSINIATLSGTVVTSFTVGAINFFFANEEEAGHNLAEAFVTAQMAGYPIRNCRQVCVGVAGLQHSGTSLRLVPALRGVMRRCGYNGDAYLTDDEQVALAGALGGDRGAILIAGDTSACYGKNKVGGQHRTGGYGELADDDGSAYAIGREILRSVARASDGRGRLTRLTAQLYLKFGLAGQGDLTRWLRGNKLDGAEICALAGLLSSACQAKDRVALEIVDKAVEQLLGLVSPVVDKLAIQKGVMAVAGKVLLEDVFIGIAFKKKISEIYPGLQCVPPRSDGATGAVLLAKERLALRGFI